MCERIAYWGIALLRRLLVRPKSPFGRTSKRRIGQEIARLWRRRLELDRGRDYGCEVKMCTSSFRVKSWRPDIMKNSTRGAGDRKVLSPARMPFGCAGTAEVLR